MQFWKCQLKSWNLGSVWIGLILLKLKTYCWNHCSKIIFKYVNSAVGPIFNEKIDKKWNLWVRKQCTDALFTEKSQHLRLTVHWTVAALLQKRVKKKKNKTQTWFMKRESKQRLSRNLRKDWFEVRPHVKKIRKATILLWLLLLEKSGSRLWLTI